MELMLVQLVMNMPIITRRALYNCSSTTLCQIVAGADPDRIRPSEIELVRMPTSRSAEWVGSNLSSLVFRR